MGNSRIDFSTIDIPLLKGLKLRQSACKRDRLFNHDASLSMSNLYIMTVNSITKRNAF